MILKALCITKTLRVVKLTAITLLAVCLHASATVSSQKVTLSAKNASLEEVFAKIKKQTGYLFFFDQSWIAKAKKVTVEIHDETLPAALDECFKDQAITYTIVGNTIVIRPKTVPLISLPAGNNDLPPPPLQITGSAVDEQNVPLEGVSVEMKGSSIGTTTDAKGVFRLEIPDGKAILVFSHVGYEGIEVRVRGRSVLNVTLKLLSNSLNEVVAIGYGTQKKVNLTGSVTNIRHEQIENKPLTQLSQVFAGQMTGMSATQASGEPGADNADILIRGRGTFSSAGFQPLVLIDGLPSSMDNIDPNSVDNISILKDAASAAIYGSKAANGVILITTKRGRKGVMNINYNNYLGWQKPDVFPDYVPTWQYAELYNEALVNTGSQALYSNADIQKFKDDPLYQNINHPKALFTSGDGFQTNHNLIFSGGNDQTTYFASLGFLKQDGLVRRNEYDRYNFTLNLDQRVAKTLKLGINIVGISGKSNEPVATAGTFASTESVANSVRVLYQMANLLPPTYPDKYPDGSYGYDGGRDSYLAALDSKSFHTENTTNLIGSINLEWAITKSLKISEKVGAVYNQLYAKNFNATFKYDSVYSGTPAWLRENISNELDLTLQTLVEYEKTMGDHSIYLLGGYSQEGNAINTYNLSRSGFPTNETTVINAGSSATMQNGGNLQEWSLRSYFGRLQYAYKDKYLLESNVRYDGSSRFPGDRRFGLFPSFSGAWKIGKEKFLQQASWINNLKVRASWGQLGNQNIGNYSFQNILSLGQNYVFGGAIGSGATLVNLSNDNISWETTRIIDYGVDVSILNNTLSLEADYFNKKTSDILYKVPTSAILGFNSPVLNAGAVLNTGWEFKLNYRNNIGDFFYSISPNISFVHTEVLDLPGGADKIITLNASDYYTVMQRGQSMNSFYGYLSDGLFVDQGDIDKSPAQPTTPKPGDIKFRDISGPNGIPDGKVDPAYDRTILGSYYPKYTFGGDISLRYKGFDFSMLFQGVAGVKGVLSRWRAMPFDDGIGSIPAWQTDRWTPDNPNPKAAQPRLLLTFRDVASDFWVRNAAYLKLKFLQAGYTIPSRYLNKIGISKLRLYFSATNLFSVSDYYKGYDPDQRVSTDARYYPVTSVYTFGLNVGF